MRMRRVRAATSVAITNAESNGGIATGATSQQTGRLVPSWASLPAAS
jgi:hypothetical protein